jgi:hypothetical protein
VVYLMLVLRRAQMATGFEWVKNRRRPVPSDSST